MSIQWNRTNKEYRRPQWRRRRRWHINDDQRKELYVEASRTIRLSNKYDALMRLPDFQFLFTILNVSHYNFWNFDQWDQSKNTNKFICKRSEIDCMFLLLLDFLQSWITKRTGWKRNGVAFPIYKYEEHSHTRIYHLNVNHLCRFVVISESCSNERNFPQNACVYFAC